MSLLSLKNRKKPVGFCENLNIEEKKAIASEIIRVFTLLDTQMQGSIKGKLTVSPITLNIQPYNYFDKFKKEVFSLNLWDSLVNTEMRFQMSSENDVANFCKEVFFSSVYKNGSENLKLSFLDWLERVCSSYAGTFYEQVRIYQSKYLEWIILSPKPQYIKSINAVNTGAVRYLINFLTENASLFNMSAQEMLESYYSVNKKQFKTVAIHLILDSLCLPNIDWSFIPNAKEGIEYRDSPRLTEATKTRVKMLNFAVILEKIEYSITSERFTNYFKTYINFLFSNRTTSHMFKDGNLKWIQIIDSTFNKFEHMIVFVFKEDSSPEEEDKLIDFFMDLFEAFTILDFKQNKGKFKKSLESLLLKAYDDFLILKESKRMNLLIEEEFKSNGLNEDIDNEDLFFKL